LGLKITKITMHKRLVLILPISLVISGCATSATLDEKKELSMKPRITLITLCVDDLERALRFYRDGLGLPTQGIVGKEFEYGAVAFFDLQPGLKLAIWPRNGHNVSSIAKVDAVMEQAKAAGANIVKPAQRTFWGGYAGYFQDPDLHLWEVAWNPQLLPAE
jgi:catechol 2,3-dioxygenase-like lactoylglutathione lyase family enzyme